MRKSLVQMVKAGIALVGTMVIMGLASCKFPAPDPIPPTPPPTPSSIDFTQVNNDLSTKLTEFNTFYPNNPNDNYSVTESLPAKDNNGNPVVYTSVASPDGKTSPVLNATNYQLAVTGNQGQSGDFKINLEYNDNGKSGITTLEGHLYNLLDVTGVLQDDETHTSQPGIVRIYNRTIPIQLSQIKINNSGGSVSTASNGATVITTNPEGTFSFQVDERADPKVSLTSLTIEAGLGNYLAAATTQNGITLPANSTDKSYIRTVQLNNLTTDVTPSTDARMNPAIRTVLNNTLLNNGTILPSTFINFTKDIEGSVYYFGLNPLVKYHVSSIEIVKNSPLDNNFSFTGTASGNNPPTDTSSQLYKIYQKALEWSNIIKNSFSDRSGLNIVVNNNMQHGQLSNISTNPIVPQRGWEVIVPVSNTNPILSSNSGATDKVVETSTYIVNKSVTYIPSNLFSLEGIVSHELGIAESYPQESQTLTDSQTISSPLVSLGSPTDVDKKFNHIIYEETYNAGEDIDNILGTSFH